MARPVRGSRPLAAALHAAAIRLLRHVRAADRSLPIGPARASALSVLVFAGPRALGELAAAEQVSAATMSRMVAGLVRSGLVSRGRDPGDARRLLLRATARARRLMAAGRERRLARLAEVLSGLTAAERAALASAVGVLDRALRAEPPPAGLPAAAGPLRRRR